MQETLATIIGEHQSEDFKNRIILLLLCSQVSLVMKCRLFVASIRIICGLNKPHNPHNPD